MKKYLFVLGILAFMVPKWGQAQCKGFTKKKCAPKLDDYIPSNKYNSLQMVQGEEAELYLVFLENMDYRLLICTHPVLGEASWRILTEQGQEVYSSEMDDGSNQFDFSTTSTEKLILSISIPPLESPSGLIQPGCVTVMVGSTPSS
jgi:hypothetical protein